MKIHNIGYLLKEGFKNLWKNRTMSIASIGVLIFLPAADRLRRARLGEPSLR